MYRNDTGYPSVTEVLMPWIDAEWFLPIHAERGSAVHAALSAHLRGIWSRPLPPEWQGYYDSGRRWIDQMVDRAFLVEERLIDPVLGFCGKPDLVAVLKGDAGASLADWKTSQATARWWRLQSAAYRHLAKSDRGIQTHRGLCVRLKRDGSGGLVDDYGNGYQMDLNVFLGGLATHRFFKAT